MRRRNKQSKEAGSRQACSLSTSLRLHTFPHDHRLCYIHYSVQLQVLPECTNCTELSKALTVKMGFSLSLPRHVGNNIPETTSTCSILWPPLLHSPELNEAPSGGGRVVARQRGPKRGISLSRPSVRATNVANECVWLLSTPLIYQSERERRRRRRR